MKSCPEMEMWEPGRFTDNEEKLVVKDLDGYCYEELKTYITDFCCSKESEVYPINQKIS